MANCRRIVNLSFSVEESNKIDEIINNSSESMSSVIRLSLRLLYMIWSRTKKGDKIYIKNQDGVEKELVILP